MDQGMVETLGDKDVRILTGISVLALEDENDIVADKYGIRSKAAVGTCGACLRYERL